MELEQVKIDLGPKTESKFPDGKIVSWENLNVSKKASLRKVAISIVCREDNSNNDILINQRGLVNPGEMLAVMGER